jgi:hypothetical protein
MPSITDFKENGREEKIVNKVRQNLTFTVKECDGGKEIPVSVALNYDEVCFSDDNRAMLTRTLTMVEVEHHKVTANWPTISIVLTIRDHIKNRILQILLDSNFSSSPVKEAQVTQMAHAVIEEIAQYVTPRKIDGFR